MAHEAKAVGVTCGFRNKFTASEWKPLEKNTLRGFFKISMPSGLVIKDCMLHESNGSRWISLPGKSYSKPDGSKDFVNIIDFASKTARNKFQTAALTAVDELLGVGHGR
ncbi:MAG: hypothetical protein ACR2JB_22075 [Bryobacteraceae bacterium]